MKKRWSIPVLALLLCLLSACTPAAPQETDPPAQTTGPEAQWQPFTGSMKEYTYLHTEDRNRDWEEDILYMADSYLSDYALLTHFPYRIEWPDDVEYSDCFYDPEFRAGFLEEVNAMILDIPEMTDTQILWRIQKLIATFGDAHACIYLPDTNYYPIYFMPFFSEEGCAIRVIALPESYGDQMFWELTHINGYSVEQIIELLRPYVSYENEQWLIRQIFDRNGGYIMREDILRITGILPPDSDTLEYRFLSDFSGVMTFTLDSLSMPQFRKVDMVGMTPEYARTLMYTDRDTENYWFRHFPEEDMLYVRINEFTETDSYSFLTMGNEMLSTAREAGTVGKLVVDLRDNPGGYHFQGYYEFVKVLQRIGPGQIYVLIDENSFSNAVVMASTIRRNIPEAVFVGTPAGQPANFFAGMQDGDYTMPNSGVILRLPTAWYYNLPEDENDALMPDIIVYPTLRDYKDGVDTILEAVKEMP